MIHTLPDPVRGLSFHAVQGADDFDKLYPDAKRVAREIFGLYQPKDMRHALLIACDAPDDYTNAKDEIPQRLIWEYAEWRGTIALLSALAAAVELVDDE